MMLSGAFWIARMWDYLRRPFVGDTMADQRRERVV